ncbi:uncharacterized protein DMENIID0001_012450 [Sergentomyia squamirostris]
MVLEIPDRASRSMPGLSTIAISLPVSLQPSEDGDFDRLSESGFRPLAEPTSQILEVCKKKFISPYVHLLGFAGLRPRNTDSRDCLTCLGHIQSVLIIVVLLAGYTLQYLLSFRRDRGFTDANANSKIFAWMQRKHLMHITETFFIYVLPSGLHFFGFASALIVFRIMANEQLQSLIERVFLVNSQFPRRLVASCWMYKLFALTWLLVGMTFVILITDKLPATTDWFTKLSGTSQLAYTKLLVATMFVQDFIQAIVLSSYAIQCFLLRNFLKRVKEKLLENTIDPLEWMREMTEFQKLLEHLNHKMATPVSFFIILNFIYTLSGTLFVVRKEDFVENLEESLLDIFNVGFWLLGTLLPLYQAASLTTKCREIQSCGHEIRIRPFLHHHTSTEDLNSVLIYASSLRMSAQLMTMPIKGGHLFGFLILGAVTITTLVMCFPAA